MIMSFDPNLEKIQHSNPQSDDAIIVVFGLLTSFQNSITKSVEPIVSKSFPQLDGTDGQEMFWALYIFPRTYVRKL